ncbi:hypothetical protein K3369_20075 [Pseudomonas mandelii]|uniref:hypothetical protein n=1 Tax=Pseudomonas mandelii TaxID=75612 RepID=UPI001C835ABE|nr:hypothetical protein [Pseudomonas mandelii]QZA96056.1 hypothetical protein K3369_20075 [Pseudomonas mandelii]
MDDKAKIAVSTLGVGFFCGAIGCITVAAQAINATWNMAVSEGAEHVIRYIVATGVASVLTIPAVILFCMFGAALTITPWTEK